MTTLITGGAGFIGTRLALRLVASGGTVRVLDNLSPQIHGEAGRVAVAELESAGCEFVFGDVRDGDALRFALAGCDSVVHLAAETGTGQSMYEICRYCDTNVMGTAVLLEAAASAHPKLRRIVVASSRAVYGEGKYSLDGQPVYPLGRVEADLAAGHFDPRCADSGRTLTLEATDEESMVLPHSIYGITKYAQENAVMLTARALGIEGVALRFQNVYGPGQSLANPYTGILSIFSNRILNGHGVDVYEDGQESRDFVYIDDVVESLCFALERPEAKDQVIGIGSGIPTPVLAVAEALAAHYASSVPIRVTAAYRVGDIRHNFASTAKAERLLGFKARIPFAEGIGRFARWVQAQPLHTDRYDQTLESLKQRGLYK